MSEQETQNTDLGSVHVIVGATHTRVVLSGEVDADLSSDLQQATDDVAQAGLPVEVDAHHVTFMDSTGVSFLARWAGCTPGKLKLLRTPPTVRFLLEVTRISDVLEIVDSNENDTEVAGEQN